ncbi:NAD(P)/FAD-dependent oxidoreductase, partial [Escherichia coli]
GHSFLISADAVILATGAQERPFPIPGWTLPGVMTAGAAQILLKTSGVVPDGEIVLAGCGPLLWLLAAQYLRANAKIACVLDTTPRSNWTKAIGYLPGFALSPLAAKGAKLLLEVKSSTRVIANVDSIKAVGESGLNAVEFTRNGTTQKPIGAKTLLLHQGVIPNVNLSMAIGCEHVWDDTQLCFRPVTDEWGETSKRGIFVAGDGAWIGGAVVAEHAARLTALKVADRLGKIAAGELSNRASRDRAAKQRLVRGRAFLDKLYTPAKQFRVPEGETIVCRCEEVTARQLRDVVALGCAGPNQAKAFLRCGMGPCQGRMCGVTVTETIAD